MKILSWNSQGLGNPRAVRAFRKLMATHQPDIMFLMETKLKANQFHFLNRYSDTYKYHTIDCSVSGGGRAGGLAILWNFCTFNLNIINYDLHYIDMLITNQQHPNTWRATGIYGYPKTQEKFLTCQLINDLSCINNNPNWCLFGDFNILLSSDEKSGGNPLDPNLTTSFRNTISLCDLQDLGYKGNTFTWTNRQQGDHLIEARLDRFLATTSWKTMFPNHNNSHLLRYQSDHCPILLEFSNLMPCRNISQQQFSRKFEQIWTTDKNHISIVQQAWKNKQGTINDKLQYTLNELHKWGENTFGIIPKRIKETQLELARLQNLTNTPLLHQQMANKEKLLDELLEKEEMWWSQRSRALWLTHGDKNTKFFHLKASQRRKKNKIEAITDPGGNIHTEKDKIDQTFLEYFQLLFTSQNTIDVTETTQIVQNRINIEQHDLLAASYTEMEVINAIKDMKSLAAPGPDGLPAKFYHTYWDIVGKDVIKSTLNVLNSNGDPSSFNSTNICLIPKTNNPTQPSDFRPISLCNVTLKIITKTMANRIKTILPDIISTNQSAFVPGRLITDNIIIAHEVFHYLAQTNSQTGFIGLKTDMAKAYDRLEWSFIRATLESMNFPLTMVNTIMKCVTTVSFSILINGIPTKPFCPQRGLRQGDPLSPYLFILCADVFSALISKAQSNKLIHGIKIVPRAPEITHLLFADDSLLFCRANEAEANQIKSIINTYQLASGQLVNYNKSEILFSKKVQSETKDEITKILPMTVVDHFNKYLGQPTHIGRSKPQVFNFIQDRVWKKLKGWKEKNLSFAGRGTLIKAVAQAIPTYLMSCFLLPKGLCNRLESMISRFWWGSNTDRRKIHWINWKKTCKQKKDGGMGFRDLGAFNEALLAKQGWRIMNDPNSLMATVLKAKYFPNNHFLKAKQGYRPSYVWQSISKASWILKKGCIWLVGNGKSLNIWEDRWLHQQVGTTIWTPKPNNTNLLLVNDLLQPHSNEWNRNIVN
jgi:exonuclease III